MSSMTIFEQVREVMVTELALKPEIVKLQSKLNEDLGADSLDATEIVTALEERFGIDIPDDEAIKVTTVDDIVQLINRKLQVKSVG